MEWLNTALFDLDSKLGRTVNIAGMLVIVLSVALSMIGTLEMLSDTQRQSIELIEITVTLLFAAEYFLRLLAAKRTLAYVFSFYGLIDLLTWLPLLVFGDVTLTIRLLRIMRLLKLIRYLRALHLFLSSIQDAIDSLLVVVFGIIIIILITGNLVHAVEPETFPDAFVGSWWGLVTMTTVGYGDVVPQTGAGKLIAACLMICGITMFAMLTATISVKIASVLNQDPVNQKNMLKELSCYCENCGSEDIAIQKISCKHCGGHIGTKDQFCAACGHQL